MNIDKTELHALGDAPHLSIKSKSGNILSTYSKHKIPHTMYKYLGVLIFTTPTSSSLIDILINEINSYFHTIQSIPLTYPELIQLSNSQLIPILLYRISASYITTTQLEILSNKIWNNITNNSSLPKSTPVNIRYPPTKTLGLGIPKFTWPRGRL